MWILVLPGVVWLVIFGYAPLYGVIIAFKDYNTGLGIYGSPWAGLKYFREVFADANFYNALRNTLMFSMLNLAFGFPVPIIFALLVNELKGMRLFKKTVQTISYMPHFLSWAFVASFLISFLREDGLMNTAVKALGGAAVPFFSNEGWFIFTIVASSLWKSFGYGSIIYLAAMASINMEMYEAAYIDGSTRMQNIRYITLPSIKPTIVILLILTISSMMQTNFEQFFLLQNNFVINVARVIDVYTYSLGFEKARLSYATAVGLFKSVVSLVLLVSANGVSRRLTGESIY